MASRGLRDMDGGPETVTDQMEMEAIERQARRLKSRAMLVATVLTALAFVI